MQLLRRSVIRSRMAPNCLEQDRDAGAICFVHRPQPGWSLGSFVALLPPIWAELDPWQCISHHASKKQNLLWWKLIKGKCCTYTNANPLESGYRNVEYTWIFFSTQQLFCSFLQQLCNQVLRRKCTKRRAWRHSSSQRIGPSGSNSTNGFGVCSLCLCIACWAAATWVPIGTKAVCLSWRWDITLRTLMCTTLLSNFVPKKLQGEGFLDWVRFIQIIFLVWSTSLWSMLPWPSRIWSTFGGIFRKKEIQNPTGQWSQSKGCCRCVRCYQHGAFFIPLWSSSLPEWSTYGDQWDLRNTLDEFIFGNDIASLTST